MPEEKKEKEEKKELERMDEGLEREVEKEIPPEVKAEMERTKEKLQEFRKEILKKFPFLIAIGLMPPQASKIVEEEMMSEEEQELFKKEEEKEKEKKLIHLLLVLPDEKEKEIDKLKVETIKLIQNIKPKIWIHIETPKGIWEICYDGKYELLDAIATSFPLHDKGMLGALRVAAIHRMMVLRKFERYVVSYVIAGSIVRGEATKTSDVDVFVIIDDTDVRRMTRAELRERLRAMIYRYVFEANEIAGVKNKLSPQIYILTEFWESVREAHPVIFTFIRDGVPLYDRGTFMPWKVLLKMGKITGTPEATEKFIAIGEKAAEVVKQKLNEIATEDIYWSVITPSQGVLMLYGLAPPTPRETVDEMKRIFVEKEKMLEQKYVDIVGKIVDIYKKYEHEKIKQISGKEIDELANSSKEYRERIKKLVTQIEKKFGGKAILRLYDDVFSILQGIFGKASEAMLVKKFSSEFVEKGMLAPSSFDALKEIIKACKLAKEGRLGKQEREKTRKNAEILVSQLTELAQRKRLSEIERIRFDAKIAGKEAEIYFFEKNVFVIQSKEIKKLDLVEEKASDTTREELETFLEKIPKEIKLTKSTIEKIEKLLGRKVEIIV